MRGDRLEDVVPCGARGASYTRLESSGCSRTRHNASCQLYPNFFFFSLKKVLALPLLLSSMSTKTSNRCLPTPEAAILPLQDSPSRLSAQAAPHCHGNLCEGCILRLAVPAFHLPPSEGDPAGRCPVLGHGKAYLKLD